MPPSTAEGADFVTVEPSDPSAFPPTFRDGRGRGCRPRRSSSPNPAVAAPGTVRRPLYDHSHARQGQDRDPALDPTGRVPGPVAVFVGDGGGCPSCRLSLPRGAADRAAAQPRRPGGAEGPAPSRLRSRVRVPRLRGYVDRRHWG